MPFRHFRRPTRVYGSLSSQPNHHLHHGRKKLTKKLFKFAILALLGMFVFGTIVIAWVSRDLPDPDRLSERQVAESTKIYDRTGKHLLYEIYQNQKRTLVDLDQISPYVVKATVSIEDKHFYEHGGIQPLSILRAAFNNLIGRSAGGGGASTLTQQLIKNAVVGDEHSYFRKIKEAILAIRMEKKYTKDQIIRLYLNEIPYGSTNYGVEAAAQSYFHKSALELSLPEAATLAALTQAPTYYLNNLDVLKERRNYVLKLMADQKYISEEEKKSGQANELKIFRNANITAAPHFVLYVKQLLSDQFGEKEVETGGLRVITTLDFDKQTIAENAVKELGDKFAKDANANNAALVSIDPRTGQILAMVGSRDFYDEKIDGQFNVAALGLRQPGSSFKPFVYTAGFEKGYTPETVLYDVLTNFEKRVDGDYIPKNYDNQEHGLVTVRKALQGSLNIPAVKMLYLVGTSQTIEFAKRFGYTTLKESAGLSLVLGGSEVNLLEHTNAYATLADNGKYHPTSAILEVKNRNGEELFEWKEPEATQAVTQELAALTTSVLSNDSARAWIFGAGGNLTLPGRSVAAKTGTTNDSKDAWTLGYTPSLAAGVWVGNTRPSPMKGGGNLLAGTIWNRFMRESLKDTVVEKFPDPPPNTAQKPVLNGADGGIKLRINSVTGKIAVSTTPEMLIVERTFLPPHTILHYVRRDDPLGPPPDDPNSDPQYVNWEQALNDWANRETEKGNLISFNEPPTEYDSVQSAELAPEVEIVSPLNNSTISGPEIRIEIRASAPRGVRRAYYRIDGIKIGTVESYPFNFVYTNPGLAPGTHKLAVTVEDDLGNSREQEINIIVP